ncbi:MAG: saccharopine dehydrogenase C-terminal domain-containing protein [Chloroflexota bacterium]
MRVLLIGCGAVGEAIAHVAQDRPWLESLVLADYRLERAQEVRSRLRRPDRFSAEAVDARDGQRVIELARSHKAELIMNAVSNIYNDALFDAACAAGCNYLDMAMSDSGANMGSHQFGQAARWRERGLLAILGMGMDPGVSDVFAAYAAKHLFDEVDEIGVRDGAALKVEGYAFAPTFSILDTIEECTDPALIWERDRGWFTTEPFSEPEVFPFPEGIGPLECVHVEHEEVVLIPRWIPCRRVTFKYALEADFINIIRVIQALGLASAEPVTVGSVSVSPREVLAACLPDPATLGNRMSGKTCVGTWVKGISNGQPRQVFLYQCTDNADTMRKYGCQAVALQTAVGPVIAMELLATGAWQGRGVLGPEAFDPDPFLARMLAFDFPYGLLELEGER